MQRQTLQQLKQLDITGFMHPSKFDLAEATRKIKTQVVPALESILGPIGQHWTLLQPTGFTQCTFHTELQLKPYFALVPDKISVLRFSCFGNLVAFQEDTVEDENVLKPEIKEQLVDTLTKLGYVYLCSDSVHTLWRDHIGFETDAWLRFFDYGKL